ncbi:MAG TPA: BatA domain-containing protein [Gemmatimonadales bacterium]
MSFLHPLALAGLAAAAIPALLHLLERRVPPELPFPAVRYLADAERRSARQLRLRHLLLLVLRTALIVAIVLAAAGPLVPSRATGGTLHPPTALVMILDNSPSAGVVVDGRPRLDRLKAVAHAALARAGAADRLWLVLADGVARAGSREALLAAVDSVRPDAHRLALAAVTARAARLVEAEPVPAREVHVVSDLQRTALDGAAETPQEVRVLALAPANVAAPNRGLGVLELSDGGLAVAITGTPGTPPGPLTVRLRGRAVARALGAPGTTVTIPLPASGPGWWAGDVEMEADELRADDARPFVWRVAPPARVAVGADGGGPFLSAAIAVLRDGGRLATGSDVTVGERPGGGPGASIVLPPADPALVGQANRALAARGVAWRFAGAGTPGPLAAPTLPGIAGVEVTRRYRLDGSDSGAVLATVNGEPWLARVGNVVLLGSRLDTAWTALPAAPGFVPFVDALANRIARGESGVREVEGAPGVAFVLDGADTVGATLSRIDPRESDLTPAPAALIRRALGGEIVRDADFAAAAFAGPRLADAGGVLLVLALLLAAAELGVATLTR